MKLQAKLAIYNTVSKVIMIVVAALVVPSLIDEIAMEHTDKRLKTKEVQVRKIIDRIGINRFIDSKNDSAFASYNLLKEEYISLEPVDPQPSRFLVYNADRSIENEIVKYRILDHYFQRDGQHYLLEIGRSLSAITERHAMLQTLAFILLLSITLITVFTDLVFMRLLLKPLHRIIDTKLRDVHHPATFNYTPIETTTTDFRYLDDSINEMLHMIHDAFEKEREFMSNVAHELLTPISILKSRYENILQDETLSESHALKVIESQKTLSRLRIVIRSLLLISQIENDQFLKSDRVDLQELLDEIAQEVEVRLEPKELSLQLNLAQPVPLIEGNRSLLFTMFFNLVNNAIKYNKPSGKIFVDGKDMPEGYLVEVKDNGPGIAPDVLPLIFNRFKRAGEQVDQDSYGLGLPIVQTIARFHDIDIKVASELGRGTVFSLLIPKAALIQKTKDFISASF